MAQTEVYLEIGKRRVFAAALDWPGWCRSGRDEASALEALAAYGARYAAAIGHPPRGLTGSFRVAERLKGDATTDFGAPAFAPSADARMTTDADLKTLARILESCWAAFDASADAAFGVELTKGPRGGGRDVDKMIAHVYEADRAYLSRLGAAFRSEHRDGGVESDMARLRAAILEALTALARGEPPTKKRGSGVVWSPRYAVRRSAWHALDHAWEIEERRP